MEIVYKGDSFWRNFTVECYADFSPTWDATWVGTYELGSLSGSLIQSSIPGVFQLRLNYTDSPWVALAVGTHDLAVEITNTTVGYREEWHGSVKIKEQRIAL